MICAIVGHRGVGKTTFLQRLKYYYESRSLVCHVFDLDHEIEERQKKSIADIFAHQGEAYFRDLEKSVFHQLVREAMALSGSVFIAVGGGFAGDFPPQVRVWWLRRPTDRLGRIFVDRPQLENEMTPLEEFMSRFDVREERFRKIYHKEITAVEGWDFVNPYESTLLGLRPANLQASVTVLPLHVENPLRLEDFIQDNLLLGVRYFEFRDDLLAEEIIRQVVKEIPADKVLISFRKPETSKSLLDFSGPYATDWALELGPSPLVHNAFVSVHSRLEGESFHEVMTRLLSHKADHYKLAVRVHDFVELWEGHRFFTEDTEHRSFLPSSDDGRWSWYRLQQHKKMKLNFIRHGEGSSRDQPLLFDFIRYPENSTGFAAVLGDPVLHSRTPAEHSDFFLKQRMGVVAIQMREDECHSLNLSILSRLGLKAAAVTSPLKTKMVTVCHHVDKKSSDLHAVNTILYTTSGWEGTNTDVNGLQAMFSALDLPSEIVVWGGGGTRTALRSLLPTAHFYSARRGEQIWVEKAQPVQPEIVVWALGRSRAAQTQNPPKHWRPKVILDLNYTEDSPGLDYAKVTGAKYISGKSFFKAQARGQREFWSQGNLK